MRKLTMLLMLFVMGLALCPVGQVLADEIPDDEIPELHAATALQCVLDTGAVNLDDGPDPDPEPDEPEPCE